MYFSPQEFPIFQKRLNESNRNAITSYFQRLFRIKNAKKYKSKHSQFNNNEVIQILSKIDKIDFVDINFSKES